MRGQARAYAFQRRENQSGNSIFSGIETNATTANGKLVVYQ